MKFMERSVEAAASDGRSLAKSSSDELLIREAQEWLEATRINESGSIFMALGISGGFGLGGASTWLTSLLEMSVHQSALIAGSIAILVGGYGTWKEIRWFHSEPVRNLRILSRKLPKLYERALKVRANRRIRSATPSQLKALRAEALRLKANPRALHRSRVRRRLEQPRSSSEHMDSILRELVSREKNREIEA